MYVELLNEGISDVKIMGINGYQYINDDYQGMIQGRILPWTQDTPETDVWGQWNVTLRDFVIVDRNGNEFARVNLTPVNPDSSYTCGENYQQIKALILAARNQ